MVAAGAPGSEGAPGQQTVVSQPAALRQANVVCVVYDVSEETTIEKVSRRAVPAGLSLSSHAHAL